MRCEPITGRWLSNDPIGINGGPNQYVFCADNPVNYTDPFGLCELGDNERRQLQATYEGRGILGKYLQIVRNHVGGPYDARGASDEYVNYTAGYSAGYAGSLGFWDWEINRQAGRLFGLAGSITGAGWHWSQIPFLGDDWVSIRELTLGYFRGRWDKYFDPYPSNQGRKCQ